MATLNVGTINFGEDVFMNKASDTADMARRIAGARRDARDRARPTPGTSTSPPIC
jgi:hypothetical protein